MNSALVVMTLLSVSMCFACVQDCPKKREEDRYKYLSVQLSPLFGKSLKGNFYFAYHYCSSINMQVVTPHTPEKLTDLADLMREESLDKVWTSGSDLAIEGTYVWMGNGKPLQFKAWHEDQPASASEDDNCMAVTQKEDVYKMAIANCSSEFVVVCEPKTYF